MRPPRRKELGSELLPSSLGFQYTRPASRFPSVLFLHVSRLWVYFAAIGLLPRKSVRSGKWPKFVRILALSLPRDDIDRLFDSAARSYGKRLIGVLLTGRLHDGTRGMQAVKQHGGVTVIQDPNSAAYPSMPKSVARQCQIDYCLPLVQIAPLLQRLVGTRLPLELESHDR